jgi:hypothetical protein
VASIAVASSSPPSVVCAFERRVSMSSVSVMPVADFTISSTGQNVMPSPSGGDRLEDPTSEETP